MSNNNYGINTGGGNVSATNLAVGDGATITISGDMRVEVTRELDAIRALLNTSEIPADQKNELSGAVETIETEAKSGKADKSKVTSALNILEQATKVGGGLVDFGVKLAPHVAGLAGFLL